MITKCYKKDVVNFVGEKCHPSSGEPILLHLLRDRPLAVGNHSFASCFLQLKQNPIVKYPD